MGKHLLSDVSSLSMTSLWRHFSYGISLFSSFVPGKPPTPTPNDVIIKFYINCSAMKNGETPIKVTSQALLWRHYDVFFPMGYPFSQALYLENPPPPTPNDVIIKFYIIVLLWKIRKPLLKWRYKHFYDVILCVFVCEWVSVSLRARSWCMKISCW